MTTDGAPATMKLLPPVLRLMVSFIVPGSLPWHALKAAPTLKTFAPLTLVRMAGA